MRGFLRASCVAGDCTMWSREQNPCLPEDGGGPETAHFDASYSNGSHVVAGDCLDLEFHH